jgi:hypothetical protein
MQTAYVELCTVSVYLQMYFMQGKKVILKIKTLISNKVYAKSFLNNRHHVRALSKDWKSNNVKYLRPSKPMGLKRTK